AFYPWLDRFSHIIEWITGAGAGTAVGRLDPVLAEAGGAVALEAAWRAILELAHGSVEAMRRQLIGEPVRYEPPVDAARQIEQFLQSLSLETLDLGAFEPRLVRLCHALDHLNQLHDDLTRVPPDASGWQPPAGFEKGARALAAWLNTTKDPRRHPERQSSRRWETLPTGLPTIAGPAATRYCKMSHCNVPRRRRPAAASKCSGGRMGRFITHGGLPNH